MVMLEMCMSEFITNILHPLTVGILIYGCHQLVSDSVWFQNSILNEIWTFKKKKICLSIVTVKHCGVIIIIII